VQPPGLFSFKGGEKDNPAQIEEVKRLEASDQLPAISRAQGIRHFFREPVDVAQAGGEERFRANQPRIVVHDLLQCNICFSPVGTVLSILDLVDPLLLCFDLSGSPCQIRFALSLA